MDVGIMQQEEPADRITTIRDACIGSLCTDVELATALDLSVRTLRRYTARGMPVVMICRRRYFEPTAVAAWLNRRRAMAA
jgi:phage terminase Nu1 subunit (DNA packaging protein)